MKSYRLSRRGFVPSAPEARESLERAGGRFIAEYECRDTILLRPGGPPGTRSDSIRLRSDLRDKGKPILVTQKIAEFSHGVKTDHPVFSFKCRSESDLQQRLAEFERDGYRPGFSFGRIGWQYDFTDASAFVELVEFLEPSIEICADAEVHLSAIMEKIGLDRFIECPLPEFVGKVLSKGHGGDEV